MSVVYYGTVRSTNGKRGSIVINTSTGEVGRQLSDATYPTWWWESEREFLSCIKRSAQWSFSPVDGFEGNV